MSSKGWANTKQWKITPSKLAPWIKGKTFLLPFSKLLLHPRKTNQTNKLRVYGCELSLWLLFLHGLGGHRLNGAGQWASSMWMVDPQGGVCLVLQNRWGIHQSEKLNIRKNPQVFEYTSHWRVVIPMFFLIVGDVVCVCVCVFSLNPVGFVSDMFGLVVVTRYPLIQLETPAMRVEILTNFIGSTIQRNHQS